MPTRILSLLAALALLVGGCGNDDWFTLEGGEFAISMPVQPKKSEIERDLPLGHLKLVEYSTTTSDGLTFTLHYTDYPSSVTRGKTADAMLDPGIDQTFSQFPHASRQNEKTIIQGFPARNFTMVDPDTGYTLFGRACLVGDRMYVIQAVMPSKLSGEVRYTAFWIHFDSLATLVEGEYKA